MTKLTVVDGPDLGNEFELEPPGPGANSSNVVLGRDPRVDVPLNDNAISREHCRIECSLRGCRIVDQGSRNRTFLNGDPVENSLLRDGDVVHIGDTELRFEDSGSAVEVEGVASTIIKEVALAVESSNGEALFDKVRTAPGSDKATAAEHSLEHVLAEVQSILHLSKKMAETSSAPELLERFLAAVVPALEASHGAFLVKANLDWTVRSSVAEEHDPGKPLRASLTIVEKAAEEKKAILSENTGGDSRFKGKDSVIQEHIRSVMAVPVLSRRRVMGIVYVDRRQGEPFSERELVLLQSCSEPLGGLLAKLEEQSRLVDENRNLLRVLTENRRIIGNSKPIQDVLDFIHRAAPTHMTVLIHGETGTGKELVASAIHYNSPRRSRPFVAINCAALPENLVESELFGHERGAFTGAVSRKKGRFELAHTGTVFLDEVGELSLPCQAKLLRLLEERRFERVGGGESISVDVRIIAATNKKLMEAVSAGEFREDVYYRLSVLNVRLPALRERTDDLPFLVDHFLENAASGGRPKKLSKTATKKLHRYEWPGNVRQLRNVIESATVLGRGDEIQPEDLVLPEKPRSSGNDDWSPIKLQELERKHILRVLEHTRGNKKRAAEMLGIERCTLYSKLKSYDL